jgi:hypothetical protein
MFDVRMRILISVSESEDFESSKVGEHVSQICDCVSAHPTEFLLMPQRGKLMDLLKMLNENGIAYHVRDLASTPQDGN